MSRTNHKRSWILYNQFYQLKSRSLNSQTLTKGKDNDDKTMKFPPRYSPSHCLGCQVMRGGGGGNSLIFLKTQILLPQNWGGMEEVTLCELIL